MENSIYDIDGVEFNYKSKTLIFGHNHNVNLSNRESLILHYLVENPNKAITLAEIIQRCLSQSPCSPTIVRKIISQLSHKLANADHIQSLYIDCYRFNYHPQAQHNLLYTVKRCRQWFIRRPEMMRTSVN